MKKVVYISNSTIPSRTANSIHVMKMCNALAANNCDVTLLAYNKLGDLESNVKDVYQFYNIPNSINLKRFQFSKNKINIFRYGYLAARYAKKMNADFVYCRDLVGCYFASLMGVRVIFEAHSPVVTSGNRFVNLNDFIKEFLFKKIIACTNFIKLIVITDSLKNYFIEKYSIQEEKIEVAPDGSDPFPDGVVAVELPNKTERLQIGYVGHLYKGKGMEIISRLAPKCNWADFHIVGGLKEDLNYWTEKCSSINNLTFHGFVPHERTHSYLKAFDIVLLPNQVKVMAHGSKENIGAWTSPLKAFEYMAAGKPILASNIPVLKEIFKHKKNALLCAPNCTDDWYDKINILKNDKNLMCNIAENSKSEFLENYTWEKRAAKLLSKI